MTAWQRNARLLIAVVAVTFSVAVALAVKRRVPVRLEPPEARTDPKAVVESASGRTVRINGEHEDIRIDYHTLMMYSDGSSKMLGVTVVTQRAGGRTFTITGKEGQVADQESNVSLAGDVQIAATDGMTLRTETATYEGNGGTVHAPGPVEFTRGHVSGTGTGFLYQKDEEVITILEAASIHVAPDAPGAEPIQINAGTAVYDRNAKIIHFDRLLTATRGGETITADAGVAHLSDDENRLELLELRGRSHVMPAPAGPGGVQALAARDMDITYGADGQTIEHAVLTGEGAIQLVGDEGRPGRRINGNNIVVALAPDGVTPEMLTARENVQLALPPDATGAGARTITAQTMDGVGQAGRGLTSAHFTGNVQYRERGADVDRVARSAVLDVALAPTGGAIDEARFMRAVHFQQGDLTAYAAAARYVIASQLLLLSGSEPGIATPHMENDRIAIDAPGLDVTLTGPHVQATGGVKSVLRPQPANGSGKPSETKMPSMLKQDQAVNVTADALDYDGAASRATYVGAAQLWQSDTTIKGSSITIDDKTGDLSAEGVATRTMLVQEGEQGRERVASIATAAALHYEEAQHRAAYTGGAHLTGPAGDVTAPTVDLYLKDSGDEIDRLEAADSVTLREQNGRKTTGTHLLFFGSDNHYLVTGAPVKAIDDCGRETTGRTLTFAKATDRILVDGNEQIRTQTKGGNNCK